MQHLGSTPDQLNQKLYSSKIKFPGDSRAHSNGRGTGLFHVRAFSKLSIIRKLCGLAVVFQKCLAHSQADLLPRPRGWKALGGRRPAREALGTTRRGPGFPPPPAPAGLRTCRPARSPAASALGLGRRAGPGVATPRAPGRAGRWDAPGPRPRAGEERAAGQAGPGPRAGAGCWEPGGPRTQAPRWGHRDWVPGMSFTRKKGFYKQDVNKTAWELPKTYVSPTHVGSGAYGAVW